MKKRLIAFLLVLIMVLGMLPVSALAADGSCKVAVQIDQGHYYTSAGDETGINRYECTLSVDDSSEHTFGYEFIWNSDAGGKSYDGGWQLCLTVDGTPAEKPNAYVYSNNMAGAKAVIAKFSGEELKRDRNASCAARLVMQDYGEMDYRKTYTLNFDANGGKDAPPPQTIKSSTGKATFKITAMTPTRQNYVFQGWSKTQDGDAAYPPRELIEVTDTSTTLYAVWEKNDSPVPDNPGGTKPDVANAQVKICVQCIEDSATHQPKNYGILPGAYVDGLLQVDGTYYYSITLNRAKYIEKFDQDSDKTHTDTEPNESIQFKWQWKNGKWELISDIAPVIKVKCDTTTKPSKPALNEGSPVLVQCVQAGTHTDSGKDLAKRYFALGGYANRYEEVKKEGSNVWKDEADNKWTYQLKLKRDEFVKAYNNLSLVTTHTDTNPGEETYVTWKYDGRQWNLVPVNGLRTVGAIIEVTCEPEAPTADELKKLEMAVLVKCVVDDSQQHTQDYGLLGEYDKDYFVGEPKKVGDDWLCDISYDPDPYVAEFNKAFPTPKHIQNDEKIVPVTLIWVGGSWQIKTQGRVLVTEVYTVTFDSYGGTPVPPAQEVEYGLTATEPAAPEKTGYTFDGWYLGDEKYDFSAAVEQNITLTAKWHVTLHNIYAYARLNSYVAPLTTSEFDTPVTLNEATLSRLGLGSYNSLGYISIGSFTFDAMPLTSDLYFGDDAELSAVAEKLATDIALETGVSDKIAEKIAWTALYKTVNEEDMEPGYPAEAGYQLSGNLNLATVMFKANGENVTGMPTVNYTYDDIFEIHDFYFAGDTFTMPADPTREGYSFEGWSVKVIPDENDADHLDADGEEDAADETLLKAGDTYTITAGGVIFTAQWEKKTFTVKYYLPDETGAWVEKKMDTVDSVDYATYSLWTPNAEDGYEFSGWYQKTADIGVKAKVEKLYMAKEWKLYGKFTPIEYTIQYVYNDGKATSTNPTTYTVESDTITLADATGADWGKTFLEWHDENGQKITEIPTGSTGNRVITAYWNWPVHLHYLDKDNNEIDSATLYVSELEPGACVLPTGEKTGYDFDGWYEAKKDIGTASHKLNALSIAKKWELYGRYTAKTDVSYTVKYLREGDNKVLAPEKVVTDQTFDTEVTEQAADVVGYTPDAPSKTMILDEYNKVLTFSYSANTYDYTVRHIKQLPDGSYDEENAEVETLSGKFEALAAVTAKDYGSHYPTNDADTKQNIKIEEGLTIDVKYDLDEHTLTFETNGAPPSTRSRSATAMQLQDPLTRPRTSTRSLAGMPTPNSPRSMTSQRFWKQTRPSTPSLN